MLKSRALFVRPWILALSLAALAVPFSACQYSGSFEGKRCSTQSDCAADSQCVEGYCVSTDVDRTGELVNEVELTPASTELVVGEQEQLTASPLDVDGEVVPDVELEWSSTDEQIATVDAQGMVTAVAPGTAIIAARAGDTFETATVTVTEVPVESVVLDPQTLDLKPGEEASLSATVLDADGAELADREVRWSTDSPSVAVVDQNGFVVAISPGEATITATSGEASAPATVTVVTPEITSIELSPSTLELTEGGSFSLNAQVRDENNEVVEGADIAWTTSDDTVATVDTMGVVTAVAEGTATVTAAVGDVEATADITVVPPAVATIELSPRTASLEKGDTLAFTAKTFDANTNELTWPTITLSSSDDTIASVDASGTVTAHELGTVVITAEAQGVTQSSAITVVPKSVADLSISPGSSTIEIGQNVALTAEMLDAGGGTLTDPQITWTSSDTSVAVVDADGVVFGQTTGSATITAEAPNGTTATATVQVDPRSAASIAMQPQSASIELTQTLQLDTTVRAADNTILEGRTVSFTSSDDTIASVNSSGVVTAQNIGGPVTITATIGGHTATTDISVTERTVESVDVTPQIDSVEVGNTITLTATPLAADGSQLSGRAVNWSSDDSTIASVDNQGVVTGAGEGVTLIRATVAGETGFASVRVTARTVASVSIPEGDQTISKGASVQLSATLADANGDPITGANVAWASDDTSVAVVDSAGKVTGIAGGQAIITASSGNASATVTITVTANSAPSADPASVSTDEDTPLAITLTGTDAESGSLTYSIANLPKDGTLSGLDTATGEVTYTPDADYNGADSFTFTVTDSAGATDSATVSLTVNAVNDAPVAADDSATTPEETSVGVDVLANDADAEGDTLTVSISSQPSNGSVTINADESITYDPNADFAGTDSFSYQVSDGTDTATATVRVTVTNVNDAPVANADSATTDEDHSVTVNVLANDTDTDGDALTVGSTTNPANGTVTANGDGTVTYTPADDFNGPDSFTYEVSDGTDTTTATVSVVVNAVNDLPEAVSDSATTDEETLVNIDVLANDSDVETMALTVQGIALQPANGTATVLGDNTIDYTPATDFVGTDVFAYTVTDDDGGTASVWVEVTVTAVNDDPVALTGPDQNVNQGDTVQLDGSASYDVDGDVLAYTWTITNEPAGPGATLSDPNAVSPTFMADKTGTYDLQLTVDDGTTTNTDTVTITVQ